MKNVSLATSRGSLNFLFNKFLVTIRLKKKKNLRKDFCYQHLHLVLPDTNCKDSRVKNAITLLLLPYFNRHLAILQLLLQLSNALNSREREV